MNLFLLHGILQSISFLVLFPLGALIAYFREYIGPQWLILHVSLQTIGFIVVLLSLIILYIAKKKSDSPRDEKKSIRRKLHTIIGPIVVMLVFIQFGWAFYGKKFVEWMTWYYIHIALSVSIISGGIFNVYLGITMK